MHAYFSLGPWKQPLSGGFGVQVVCLGSDPRTQGCREVGQGEGNPPRRCLLGLAEVSWGFILRGPLGDEADIAQNRPI